LKIETLAAAIVFWACTTLLAAAGEAKVVVTSKPVHALVAQVMQGTGVPLLIVDGSASPHAFTLKPSAARAINEADVFFRVSEGLEPFTRKIAAALPQTVKLISLADSPGITVLPQRHGDTFEPHDDNDQAGAAVDVKDEHIWLDPANAKAIVAYAAKVLSEAYPDRTAAFLENAAAVTVKIDTLDAGIEAQSKSLKGKPFIVFHDATQYFERRYGLAAAGSVTVTPDVQPSAKRLTALRKKIIELGAVCVFAEPGFQPNLVAAVTEGTKARSGTLDPEGISLAAGPDTYFELMRNMAGGLTACFDAPG
jgi:zinc transport system substrate-binding protein